MPNGNKPTKNEHFVPRMYLKGFSEIKENANKQKAYIWEFSLKSMKQIPTQVDIEKILYQNVDKNMCVATLSSFFYIIIY